MLGGKCRIGQRGLLHSFEEANQGGAKPDPGILTRRDVRLLQKPMRKKTSPSPHLQTAKPIPERPVEVS